jgi:hypothetical protein
MPMSRGRPSAGRGRPPRWPLVPLLLVGTAVCRAPDEPSVGDVAGTYTLEHVGGSSLPATVTVTSVNTVVLAATRVLSPDGSCRETATYSYAAFGGVTATGSGTGTMTCRWSLAGGTVRFELVDNGGMYFYQTRTTATVGRDGSLTEDYTNEAGNGGVLYPRTYRR